MVFILSLHACIAKYEKLMYKWLLHVYNYFLLHVSLHYNSISQNYYIDMGWPTKGSGKSYNFHTGFASMIGGCSDKALYSMIFCRLCRICDEAKRLRKK